MVEERGMVKMDRAAMEAFLLEHFPQGQAYGHVEEVGFRTARMRLPVDEQHLRPGGTVSGPVMMGLADVAVYVAVLGQIGPVPLAVTTSLNINFLHKPASGRDIIAEAKLLKLGKRLAVGEVGLFSEGNPEPVAHVTCTYSIPPGAVA